MITVADSKSTIKKYRLVYENNGEWKTIFSGENPDKIKIHRFDRVWGGKVKIIVDEFSGQAEIAEFGVYNEQR
jgi:alpha-L-fucosidase